MSPFLASTPLLVGGVKMRNQPDRIPVGHLLAIFVGELVHLSDWV